MNLILEDTALPDYRLRVCRGRPTANVSVLVDHTDRTITASLDVPLEVVLRAVALIMERVADGTLPRDQEPMGRG